MYAVAASSNESARDVWPALADATRRALIDRLADGPKTTSQLCDGMPMSRFGVMKHLGILERAGLVTTRRHGRFRINHLNAAPLRALQDRWLSPRAEKLASSIDSFATSFGDRPMPSDLSQTAVVDVTLDWDIPASVQQVWSAIFERPQDWWPTAHRAGPEGSKMHFEPKVGGQLREERSDGAGIVWYQLIALDPMRSIDLSGQLAMRYGGPATSLLHLELLPGANDGTTVLKLTDSVFGRIGADMRASLTSGWQAIIGDGLVRLLREEK